MEEEIKDYICPISLKIFKEPYVASDGFTYDKKQIERWLKKRKSSPMTNETISNNICPCKIVKKNVKQLYEKYPELYFSEYHNNELDIMEFMDEEKIKNTSDEQFEIMINETSLEDLNNIYENNMLLIHYICRFGTPNKIKTIIDKGVNLECQTKDGERIRPIHLLYIFSTPEMIKYIIDKGVNLECKDEDDWRPIHYICNFSTTEMIKYIIDKNVDLECVTNENWRPIHFICKYSTLETIKYIIDKGVYLKFKTNEKLSIIDLMLLNDDIDEDTEEYISTNFCNGNDFSIIQFIKFIDNIQF